MGSGEQNLRGAIGGSMSRVSRLGLCGFAILISLTCSSQTPSNKPKKDLPPPPSGFVVVQQPKSRSVQAKRSILVAREYYGPENCADTLNPALNLLVRLRDRRLELVNATDQSSEADLAAAERVLDSQVQREVTLSQLTEWRTVAEKCFEHALATLPQHRQDQVQLASDVRALVKYETERRGNQSIREFENFSRDAEDKRSEFQYKELVAEYNFLVQSYNALLQSVQQYAAQDAEYHRLVNAQLSRPIVVPSYPVLPPPRRNIYCSSSNWGSSISTTCYER